MTTQTQSNTLFKLSRLKAYNGHGAEKTLALKDLDLTIPKQKFICLSGPNGSGKTTLLNLLSSLAKPDNGTIRLAIDGEVVNIGRASNNYLGYYRQAVRAHIFQSKNLIDHLSVKDNLLLGLRLQNANTTEALKKFENALDEYGIASKLKHKASSLSGGEQQLIAVIRAINSGARIILADEPTGDLDINNTDKIMNLLKTAVDHNNMAVIMVSHDIDAAKKYCNFFLESEKLPDGGNAIKCSNRTNQR